MIRAVRSMTVAVTLATLGAAPDAMAQTGEADRNAAPASAWVPAQSVTSAPLRRTIDLDLDQVSVPYAIREIAKRGRVAIGYDGSAIASKARVSLHGAQLTVNEALAAVLSDTGLEAYISMASGQIVVRAVPEPAPLPPAAPLPAVGTITGTVTEAGTSNPIVNAQIAVDGAGRAFTDAEGRYRITNVPAGRRSVSVTSLGYRRLTQEVEVADGATVTLDFALELSPTTLNELVVTATGEQRRVELGHVIGRIDVDSLAVGAPIRSLNDVLTARVPGVQVFAPGGLTGLTGRIRVRGLGSFSVSNDPLVLVDGVRVESSTPSWVFPQSTYVTGRLADLNPRDIETIDIVKGPSAATLYGTDAANGVILITTRRARPGRSRHTVYIEQGIIEPDVSRYRPNWHAFGHSTTTGADQHCALLDVAGGICVQDSLSVWNSLRQSPSSPLATGYRGVYGLQTSGGAAAGITYFLSGEYEKELGYLRLPDVEQEHLAQLRSAPPLPEQVRPNAMEKISLRANLRAPLGQKGELALSSGLVFNETRQPNTQVFDGPVRGRGVRGTDDAGLAAEWAGRRPAAIFAQVNEEDVTRFTGGLQGTYRPYAWLTTRGKVGVDVVNDLQTILARRGEGVFLYETGHKVDAAIGRTLYSLDLSGTATAALSPDLSSRTAIGVQYNRRREHTTTVSATGLAPGAETVAGAEAIAGSESTTETIVAGMFVEQTLTLSERLFLTGALRLDGASSFGDDFNTAIYPKVSLSWLALDGSRAAPLGLSMLRFRTAYGASGVQPGPTAALATNSLLTGLVDGAQVNATSIATLGNPNLKPERRTEVELGLDAEWLSGRVGLEATFYSKDSRDALIDLPWAPGLGVTGTQQFNVGAVRNRGFEGLLRARLVDRRALAVDVALNGSVNANTLLTLGDGVPVSGAGNRQVPGYPLYGWWGRPILSYSDANENGIIETNEVVVGDTAVYLGNALPKDQLGVTLTIGTLDEQLRLTALGDYRGGSLRWNGDGATQCAFFRSCRAVNDPETPLAEQAAAVAATLGHREAGYLHDASFFRLRELGLTYMLSERVAQWLGASTLTVDLMGRNLFVITEYPGVDPEGSVFPDRDSFQEFSPQPQGRYFLLRVSAGF